MALHLVPHQKTEEVFYELSDAAPSILRPYILPFTNGVVIISTFYSSFLPQKYKNFNLTYNAYGLCISYLLVRKK